MVKREKTTQEIYKRNQLKAKVLRISAPIVFWAFIALSLVCLILAIKNSFGNIGEIIDLLDNKNFTGAELQENYNYLTAKYGEWLIGSGGSGFQITFINIGHALFSGLAITSLILCVLFFASAYLLGKWLLPHLSRQILEDNQEMINMKILASEK